MRFFVVFFFNFFLFNIGIITANEIECQGAVLRVLNKITTEKSIYSVPLSQTLELENANIIIYKCIKTDRNGKEDELALMKHYFKNKQSDQFLGWIFKSSQYINTPTNPVYDIKLEECLVDDPLFIENISNI